RLVRKIAAGDGDGPLPGDVVPGRGRGGGLLEGPLLRGAGVVREPVVRRLLRGYGVRVGPLVAVGGHAPGARGGGVVRPRGRRYPRRYVAVTRCGQRAVAGQEGVDAALGELDEGGGAVVVVALGQRVPAAAALVRALSVLVFGHDSALPSARR